MNKKNVIIIMIDGGRYDRTLNSTVFNELKSKKFFVWGENDLNYFSHLLSTKKEKFFISGSPRHDNFFETTNSSTDKNIVITLPLFMMKVNRNPQRLYVAFQALLIHFPQPMYMLRYGMRKYLFIGPHQR